MHIGSLSLISVFPGIRFLPVRHTLCRDAQRKQKTNNKKRGWKTKTHEYTHLHTHTQAHTLTHTHVPSVLTLTWQDTHTPDSKGGLTEPLIHSSICPLIQSFSLLTQSFIHSFIRYIHSFNYTIIH